MSTVVLLAEQPPGGEDVDALIAPYADAPGPVRYHLVIPERVGSRPVEAVLQDIAIAEGLVGWGAAEQALYDPLERARADAEQTLAETTKLLRERGLEVTGEVTSEDPVSVLCALSAGGDVDALVIFARHHVVSEAFHRDLSSRCRRKLAVPVTHVVPQAER
jgi:nucleotide-binding universal stress UspA family protein